MRSNIFGQVPKLFNIYKYIKCNVLIACAVLLFSHDKVFWFQNQTNLPIFFLPISVSSEVESEYLIRVLILQHD